MTRGNSTARPSRSTVDATPMVTRSGRRSGASSDPPSGDSATLSSTSCGSKRKSDDVSRSDMASTKVSTSAVTGTVSSNNGEKDIYTEAMDPVHAQDPASVKKARLDGHFVLNGANIGDSSRIQSAVVTSGPTVDIIRDAMSIPASVEGMVAECARQEQWIAGFERDPYIQQLPLGQRYSILKSAHDRLAYIKGLIRHTYVQGTPDANAANDSHGAKDAVQPVRFSGGIGASDRDSSDGVIVSARPAVAAAATLQSTSPANVEQHRQSSPDWPSSDQVTQETAASVDVASLPVVPVVRTWFKISKESFSVRYMGFPFNHEYTGSDLQRILAFEASPGKKDLANLATTDARLYTPFSFVLGATPRDLVMRKKKLKGPILENQAMRFYLIGSVTHSCLAPGLSVYQKNQQICIIPGYSSFPRAMANIAKILGDNVPRYRNLKNLFVSTYNTGISLSTMMQPTKNREPFASFGAVSLPSQGANGSSAPRMIEASNSRVQANGPDTSVSHGPFVWHHAVLPNDSAVTVYDGTRSFHLSQYQQLPVIDAVNYNRLEPKDVVLVVFTLGHYTKSEFRDGPCLSFNVQDIVLLNRLRDHRATADGVRDNGEPFPVSVPNDIKHDFQCAKDLVGDPKDLRERFAMAGSQDDADGVPGESEAAADGEDEVESADEADVLM